ncbi:MAG: TraB/GumN family protein [Steroidobacteraceae bacterium]
MESLKALLARRDDVLVVVGALHLVGDGSVIERLRNAGLAPERLRAD